MFSYHPASWFRCNLVNKMERNCCVCAAFLLINDIKDYNKLGGLKKQLATLYAQIYTVNEVCSDQYQAMVALVKLKSNGITEECILNLNNFFLKEIMIKSIQHL